ncbi:hypothetical protein C8R45DRAFT_1090189 [Mycena sanguinolenta]|nr:hypothetical protein C8R45DRAFT_1090189 [Mycena sanguinolenta]
MNVDELLNVPEEDVRIDNSTEKEICAAVTEKRALEQMLEINGSDDHDTAALAPGPSRLQALEAALTLREYILDRDDEFARQMEVVLARFGRQTCLDGMKAMRETQMTDYFSRVAV